MKKKWTLTLILVVTLVLAVLTLASCGNKNDTIDETPLEAQTVEIATAADLAGLKDYVGKKYSNYTFVLQNDISLDEYTNWEPIGKNLQNAFSGTFDGNGHTVSNMKIYGIDENGAPISMADRQENATSFYAAGLFGYLSNATVKNLILSDVNIQYYVDLDFGYTAALAGYAYGDCTISDVTVDGDIELSNLYEEYMAFDDKGNPQGINWKCDSTSYIGGAVAYATGNVRMSGVTSSVDINNDNYIAYYRSLTTGEEEEFEEGYVVQTTYDFLPVKPNQVFAGGVAGYLKGGRMSGANYDGAINVSGRNVYTAGIAGCIFNAEVSESSVNGGTFSAKGYNKNVGAGITALADNGIVKDCDVKNASFDMRSTDSTQALTLGGIFGILCNLGKVSGSDAENNSMLVYTQEVNIGGVGGIIRNADMENCNAKDTTFRVSQFSVSGDYYTRIATVIGAVYGTSRLKDCIGNGRNALDRNASQYGENTVAYSVVETISYVDEEGNTAVRLYKNGSIDEYITVAAELNEDRNSLKITLFDEELQELSSHSFAITYKESDLSGAEAYLDSWFEVGVGIKGVSDAVPGRDLTQYEFRSGRPTVENVVVGVAE